MLKHDINMIFGEQQPKSFPKELLSFPCIMSYEEK